MQRFEETKCCVVDGRDHVLKGFAVFGVTCDRVHLRRWGAKEVRQKGDEKARIGRNLELEILFVVFKGVVKIWIVVFESAIERVVVLLWVDGGLFIRSANILQR